MIGVDRCELLSASIAIPYRLSLAKVRERFVEVAEAYLDLTAQMSISARPCRRPVTISAALPMGPASQNARPKTILKVNGLVARPSGGRSKRKTKSLSTNYALKKLCSMAKLLTTSGVTPNDDE